MTTTPDNEYTPTTEEMRNRYAAGRRTLDPRDASLSPGSLEAEFDRWLTQHDAEVREGVAREIEAASAPDPLTRSLAAAIARGAR